MHQILSNAHLCLDNFGTLEALNIKIIFRKFFFNMVVGTDILHRVSVVHKLRKGFCLFKKKNNTGDFLLETFQTILKYRVIFCDGSDHFILKISSCASVIILIDVITLFLLFGSESKQKNVFHGILFSQYAVFYFEYCKY